MGDQGKFTTVTLNDLEGNSQVAGLFSALEVADDNYAL